MATETDITKKRYTKLILQVSEGSFSYAIVDTITKQVLTIKEVIFPVSKDSVTDLYWNAFVANPELTKVHDEYLVLHDNNLHTLVPTPLFDEDYLGSYLQYNNQVFETDFFSFDHLPAYDLTNVYIPYVNINNFLLDQFGEFTYKSASTILISRLLDFSRNQEQAQVFAHFGKKQFELVAVRNQQLLLSNTFSYTAKEDFLYFLLFAAEQLQLNPEQFNLQLLGKITKNDPYYELAYQYVRHVSMLDFQAFLPANGLTEDDNRRYFLLTQA